MLSTNQWRETNGMKVLRMTDALTFVYFISAPRLSAISSSSFSHRQRARFPSHQFDRSGQFQREIHSWQLAGSHLSVVITREAIAENEDVPVLYPRPWESAPSAGAWLSSRQAFKSFANSDKDEFASRPPSFISSRLPFVYQLASHERFRTTLSLSLTSAEPRDPDDRVMRNRHSHP